MSKRTFVECALTRLAPSQTLVDMLAERTQQTIIKNWLILPYTFTSPALTGATWVEAVTPECFFFENPNDDWDYITLGYLEPLTAVPLVENNTFKLYSYMTTNAIVKVHYDN